MHLKPCDRTAWCEVNASTETKWHLQLINSIEMCTRPQRRRVTRERRRGTGEHQFHIKISINCMIAFETFGCANSSLEIGNRLIDGKFNFWIIGKWFWFILAGKISFPGAELRRKRTEIKCRAEHVARKQKSPSTCLFKKNAHFFETEATICTDLHVSSDTRPSFAQERNSATVPTCPATKVEVL